MLLKFRDFGSNSGHAMPMPARCFTGSKRAPASAARISAVLPTSPSAPVPAAVPLPDNDDLLLEILLRLPPLPSSLPRASLVCKRWRRVIADPFFRRRFHQHHHGTPAPLLGYFFSHANGPIFVPTLAPPDCIPRERFSLPRQQPAGDRLFFLGCRQGLALLINRRRLEAIVWDPVTGCRAAVAYPPEFTTDNGAHCCRGTVLSTAAGAATADGDGHVMRPFKVILIRTDVDNCHMHVFMCVYVSETAKWGHTVSTIIPSISVWNLPNVLVGNALCGFLQVPNGILEYDLERHSLSVVQTPKILDCIDTSLFQVVRTPDGELGLAILSELSMELWVRRKGISSSSDGVVGWVLQKTIQLDNLLSLPRMNMMKSDLSARILAFDEDNNAIHVSTSTGAFAIRLDSMRFTELVNVNRSGSYHSCHPYAGFYTAGVPGVSTA